MTVDAKSSSLHKLKNAPPVDEQRKDFRTQLKANAVRRAKFARDYTVFVVLFLLDWCLESHFLVVVGACACHYSRTREVHCLRPAMAANLRQQGCPARAMFAQGQEISGYSGGVFPRYFTRCVGGFRCALLSNVWN